MKTYKHWDLYDDLPDGWKIDSVTGSPLAGSVFITDGISVLNGGKRALLLIADSQKTLFHTHQVAQKEEKFIYQTKKNKIHTSTTVFESGSAKTANELARAKFKEKLLRDILVDLTICEIEGWDKMSYINELKSLIASICDKSVV